MVEKSKISADKQRENSAKKKARGKPFAKGNNFAWKPGQSGNKKGRPKVKTLSEAYRQYLAQVDPDDSQERTRAEVAAERIFKLTAIYHPAAVGAFKELADRTEGKPRQAVEINVKKQAAERLAVALGIPIERLPYGAASENQTLPRNIHRRN